MSDTEKMKIPDAAVEAAARAQYATDGLAWDDGMVPDWESEDDSLQESYRTAARLALEAAAPHVRAQALEDSAAAWQVRMDTTGRGSADAKLFMQQRAAREWASK